MAWQWLKQAAVAKSALKDMATSKQSSDFYESKMETMKYFFKYELPKHLSISNTLMNPEIVTIKQEREILI